AAPCTATIPARRSLGWALVYGGLMALSRQQRLRRRKPLRQESASMKRLRASPAIQVPRNRRHRPPTRLLRHPRVDLLPTPNRPQVRATSRHGSARETPRLLQTSLRLYRGQALRQPPSSPSRIRPNPRIRNRVTRNRMIRKRPQRNRHNTSQPPTAEPVTQIGPACGVESLRNPSPTKRFPHIA